MTVDPLTVANTAIAILKSTTEALNALRERAQRSKDIDIKEQINALYDNVLQLKEVVSRLLDENKELKCQLEHQQLTRVAVPKIKQVGQTNYYFQGDEGPYCQPCFVNTGKLVAVLPIKQDELGGQHRDCPVCHASFYETPNSNPEAPTINTRLSWMR